MQNEINGKGILYILKLRVDSNVSTEASDLLGKAVFTDLFRRA